MARIRALGKGAQHGLEPDSRQPLSKADTPNDGIRTEPFHVSQTTDQLSHGDNSACTSSAGYAPIASISTPHCNHAITSERNWPRKLRCTSTILLVAREIRRMASKQ